MLLIFSGKEESIYLSSIIEENFQEFQDQWYEVIFDSPGQVPSFLASDETISNYHDNNSTNKHLPFGKRTRSIRSSHAGHQQGNVENTKNNKNMVDN